MLLRFALFAFATCFNLLGVSYAEDLDYEFIVVGSGAGGGPLAARLALAGHKTLLIEAGDDQGSNNNYTVPAYQAKSTEDPSMAWDFFVRHYANDTQQKKDYKLTYNTPNGGEYTGLNPPPGSTIKGILYPRSATLGGCTAHNALVTIYPDRDDFQYLADLTGDQSWLPDNMRKYFIRMESIGYVSLDVTGHGYDGWFGDALAPIDLALEDLQLTSQLLGASFALGNYTGTVVNLATLLAGDANADGDLRDSTPALYQIPIATRNRTRNGSREFILQVRDAKKADGSKAFPLDVRMNCHVTKVTFDNSTTPKATGVEFLDGKYLYRASKRAGSNGSGTPGSAKASREVIISGGSYNSPQILKLSGIGPAAELRQFGIPVIKDLPGVGGNLQDHYEISVQSTFPSNFTILDGCTFGFYGQPDPCLDRWKVEPRLGVTYDSSGFAGSMFFKSTTSPDGNYDVFAFGGPVNFRGYFPNYSVNATINHNYWSWALLKSHPRNRAGSVTLRTADPLDTPNILFNFFQDGGDEDLEAMYESIILTRDAFKRQPIPYTEVLPGSQLQSKQEVVDFVKNNAWSHHCSSTCAIGTDDDPMAVLDSSFRVRGVQGLRVVDASVYPRIPGTFTAVSTYMVGEKAADVILSQLQNSTSASTKTSGVNVNLSPSGVAVGVNVGGLGISLGLKD
ncbi:GMC oxidoreductase [Microthyrium microscopicum]|uniref:GMC oxidoreductase n=1 Tax=Microthyrium microscopicum TaxID=703497 RepID=A0A6A6UQF0_9PEZI|nr:GMC oxidoreductase [Microthyrium microscopicum]